MARQLGIGYMVIKVPMAQENHMLVRKTLLFEYS